MADPPYASPSPVDAPLLWGTLAVGTKSSGDFTFPDDPEQGICVVTDFNTSQKLDQQKALGKSKAKQKQGGIDNSPFSVELRYTNRIWAPTRALILALDPNGPDKGGPFTLYHPEPMDRGITTFMVKKIGKTTRIAGSPYIFSTAIEFDEWNEPKPGVGGGVGTPKDARDLSWTGAHEDGISAAQLVFGDAAASFLGLDGKNAPDAKP